MSQAATLPRQALRHPQAPTRSRRAARAQRRMPNWQALATAAPAEAPPRSGATPPRSPKLAIALVLAALLLHALVLYGVTHLKEVPAKPKPQQVAIEFVKPPEPPKPEPPKPKLEPPKVPPKSQPTPTVPPIDTPPPAPVADAAPTGPVVSPPVEGPPSPPAPPAPPAPEPVTAPFGNVGYLNNPAPDYPDIAQRMQWQGTVILHVHVQASGKVDQVDVKTGSGRKVLDDAAIRTVKKWQLAPAKRGDTAVDGWADVPVTFRLDA